MLTDKNKAILDLMEVKRDIWDIVEYISNMFTTAIDMDASDIHIEPGEHFLLIRFRKDGDFVIIDKIDNENASSIATRLKVLSKIKIDENKKPQDGKITYFHEKSKKNIDIRLSTLPTTYWEKVVMRVLKQDEWLTDITKLWFISTNLERVNEIVHKSYWIILVSGPTGSWKTTTLFGILKTFDPLEYNIETLEDPVEYNIEFINQSQVKPDIGYTFATGLRSLVRQDPDIIMVWEIRDKETAVLAVEAALTWHLVLSTIHTNTASWTVQRLINMWVEPFLLASAMRLIISQRLIKRICPFCKTPAEINPKVQERVKGFMKNIMAPEEIEKMNFFEANGCDKCHNTGYKWRLWIHEVLVVWDFLEDLILERRSAWEIERKAIENGMITIIQDGLLKAALWLTTIEEVLWNL